MKKIIKAMLIIPILIVTTNFGLSAIPCNNGGPGATECTDGGSFSMSFAGQSFEFSYENSVSCGAGYYACCNSNEAVCYSNKSIPCTE